MSQPSTLVEDRVESVDNRPMRYLASRHSTHSEPSGSSHGKVPLLFGRAHALVSHEHVEARIQIPRSKEMRRTVLIIATVVSLLAVGASAQEARSEISLQGTGFFTKDSTGQGTTQRGTETGGFLIGYRYHLNRWLAAEPSTAMTGIARSISGPRDCHACKRMSIKRPEGSW